MLDKLDWVHPRYEELGALLSDPAVVQDQEKWRALMREHSQLEPLDAAVKRYAQLLSEREEAKTMLTDADMAAMAREELVHLEEEIPACEREIQLLLLPRDPNDERNVVMEIRGGAGGEEAALFGAMLMRMYTRYAERHGWRVEMMDANMTELGGVKEAIFTISGAGAFSRLKYESGVHRVQRIPVTESNGKRQTSTATVAVLPEAEEVDVRIDPCDLRIDVYRASGHGGQYINKTDSAVRITHLPTGTVVTCQDEKSQLKNKEKAMRVLRARLYERMQSEKDAAYAGERRAQVGTGDRSERIRTYNFNEGRVSDHRIGKTIYSIDAFVDGDMDEIIDELIISSQQEQLRRMNLADG
ncbi:MAG: peptide chain release factor 1 [Candidatus Ventricola sp.]|nr:peptide chain release factor 1 [Candidatus Ventricola sp.]